MIYFVAFSLSLVACLQCVAEGCTKGNIAHLKHGRAPDASVSIFPLVPLFQFMAFGLGWVLDHCFSHYAIWVLIGAYAVLFGFWFVSFRRLSAELKRSMAAADAGAVESEEGRTREAT